MKGIEISITEGAARNPKVGLALAAAASGSRDLRDKVLKHLGTEEGYDRAADVLRMSKSGPCVGDGTKDNTDRCNIIMDPRDNAHKQDWRKARLALRRSCTPGQLKFPPWPHARTLLLKAAEPERRNRPVVSFCGVTKRPETRRAMIDAMSEASGKHDMQFNCIRREKFYAGDVELEIARFDFNRSILNSQFVLCPVGVGLFSYRMQEALAAGRIPVCDGLDQNIPQGAEVVNVGESPTADSIAQAILGKWLSVDDWCYVARKNRNAWIRHNSPYGWIVQHFVPTVKKVFKI